MLTHPQFGPSPISLLNANRSPSSVSSSTSAPVANRMGSACESRSMPFLTTMPPRSSPPTTSQTTMSPMRSKSLAMTLSFAASCLAAQESFSSIFAISASPSGKSMSKRRSRPSRRDKRSCPTSEISASGCLYLRPPMTAASSSYFGISSRYFVGWQSARKRMSPCGIVWRWPHSGPRKPKPSLSTLSFMACTLATASKR
mmetsp:Transcript_38722/g.120997  ORF Transcript_38722/g.120997 Transcript_38722/m.120997 type:complete len:200 (+) Transcript_38722:120-719(+)